MYKVIFQIDIKKQLKTIPKKDIKRILDTIESLAKNPRSAGTEKLKNRPGYRIRVGNYRIIYSVDDGKLIVCVLDIDHRKDIYR